MTRSLCTRMHVEEDVAFAQRLLLEHRVARDGGDDRVVVALPLGRPVGLLPHVSDVVAGPGGRARVPHDAAQAVARRRVGTTIVREVNLLVRRGVRLTLFTSPASQKLRSERSDSRRSARQAFCCALCPTSSAMSCSSERSASVLTAA